MSRPSQRRGFTLIELLVVISIIALLIAILLPALTMARNEARAAQCGSQQKQIGVAMIVYAEDHDQWLPYAAVGVDNQWTISWDDLLHDRLGKHLTPQQRDARFSLVDMEAVRCPSDNVKRWWTVAHQRRSYSLPRVFGGGQFEGLYWHGIATSATFGSPPSGPISFQISARLADLREPTDTLLVVEAPTISNVTGGYYDASLDNAAQQSPFGTYPDTTAPNWQQYGDPDQTLHRGTWNYLFADGHVARRRAVDTLGGRADSKLYSPRGPWTRNPND